MIIGITGKSGAGKSYLSEILAKELDMIHLDIDKISHDVLEYPETISFLHQEFGESIFVEQKLDRKALGAIVFNNPKKLQKWNDFCQIQIEKRLDEMISDNKKSFILDYALLAQLKQFASCDIKILLETNFDTRFSRVEKRENISMAYFVSRDNSLAPYDKTQFDYIFEDFSQKDIDFLINQLKKKELL